MSSIHVQNLFVNRTTINLYSAKEHLFHSFVVNVFCLNTEVYFYESVTALLYLLAESIGKLNCIAC